MKGKPWFAKAKAARRSFRPIQSRFHFRYRFTMRTRSGGHLGASARASFVWPGCSGSCRSPATSGKYAILVLHVTDVADGMKLAAREPQQSRYLNNLCRINGPDDRRHLASRIAFDIVQEAAATLRYRRGTIANTNGIKTLSAKHAPASVRLSPCAQQAET